MIRETLVHPHTGEKLGAIRLGVYLQSKTRRWADDDIPELQTPIGGHVITNGDDCWEVVTVHHGQPFYTIIDQDELDWDVYDGLVNIRSLRGVAVAINRQKIDDRALHALLALSHAIQNR